MSFMLVCLAVMLLQHFPPPPPPFIPGGIDFQSFVIEDNSNVNIDYGVDNGLFRRLVFGTETLQGLNGFCDVWENLGVRITGLNRNNWRNIIRYVRDEGPPTCASGEVTLGVACDRARDVGGQVYNNVMWCGGSYDLHINTTLIFLLQISFLALFIQYSRNFYQRP